MKITLLTYGSRGDVQPFLALAVALQAAGHAPVLAAPLRFRAFVEAHQVSFLPLPGDPEQISARFNDAGGHPLRTVRAISEYVLQIAPEVAAASYAACQGSDLIIHGFLFTSGGHAAARQLGVPDISIQTFPMFAPTRAFPNVSAAGIPPGWLSYGSHWLFDRVFRYGGNAGYRRLHRAHPDMPFSDRLPWPFAPAGRTPATPLVFAFSRHVIPPPVEWQRESHIHVPGYFHLPSQAYQPPADLAAFLAAGEPPVCITFGSMINRRMEEMLAVILEAVRQVGRRALLLSGWGGVPLSADNVFAIGSVPHDWLLPRCCLVIHHGGAGTTAAALRSGTPSMVIPLAGDQPFWARRVDALGVGPRSIRARDLSVEAMRAALQAIGSTEHAARAAALARLLQAEDGVGAGVRLVEAQRLAWERAGTPQP